MMDAMKDVVDFVEEHYQRFRKDVPETNRSSFKFLVLGSYPAHIRMMQRNMQNPIPYNDIDIFHKDIDFARYIAGKPFKPLSTEQGRKELKAVQYVRFQPHMDINYVCLSSTADLQARVHESDINAVAIGVLVTLNWITCQRKGRLIESSPFTQFLQTQTLAMCDFRSLVKPKNALASLVRLLYKAQQSNLRVLRPSDVDIVNMCHGRAIGPEHVQMYGKLQDTYKQCINHLFFFKTETDEKTRTNRWRFFSRKAAPPDVDDSRTLSTCQLALSSTVHDQVEGTCYAHAVATAVRATEKRIVGRVPMSHDQIVQQIVAKHGTKGANMFRVLQEECAERQLGCRPVELSDMMEVLQANRSLALSFRFSEDVWHAFTSFFRTRPLGVLTRQAIQEYQPDYSLPSQGGGHAVCVRGLIYHDGIPCIELKNSWGSNFADGGNFKVGLDVVRDPRFNFQLFDVFFRVQDLLKEDLRRFEEEEERIRKMKTQMLINAY